MSFFGGIGSYLCGIGPFRGQSLWGGGVKESYHCCIWNTGVDFQDCSAAVP